MKIGLGIFCSTSDNKLTTNHKLTLRSLNEQSFLEVFRKNLRDFIQLLKLSRYYGFTIFRLGSNFVPFASHSIFRLEWFRRVEEALGSISQFVRDFGVRITMHPGQFVVLNSPRRDVVERSLRELDYHFKVLDLLGLSKESVVVVHVGGVYGDKSRAVKRLFEVLEENRWLLRRLALENDERYYNVLDVLEIADSYGLPVVYDHYHHKLNPSQFSMDRLINTWKGIPPEVHVSSPPEKPARFGEHGDFLKAEDFVEVVSLFLETGGVQRVDIIPEVKKKEIAIARLVREIREKYPEMANHLLVDSSRFDQSPAS